MIGMATYQIQSTAKQLLGLRARAIVAVDGVDGAGKTTFADALAEHLSTLRQPFVRASVDGFHNPAEVRYARGRHDPKGFFLDSYDYSGLHHHLIAPFKRGETEVLTSAFDHRTDTISLIAEKVAPTALLILDGIFLHRDELVDQWDFSVFLAVPFDTSYARMAQRDGCDPDPRAPENARYYEGQLLYIKSCDPEEKADLVIKDW